MADMLISSFMFTYLIQATDCIVLEDFTILTSKHNLDMMKEHIMRYFWRPLINYWLNQLINFDTKQFDVSACEKEISEAIQLLENEDSTEI